MRVKLVCIVCIFSGIVGHSQDVPTVIPPSPEASSLGKFTEVPVSLYTGLPNISVPITTFEVGGRSFPVSLSYHARGVKVNEIASRVGIGWALNAGGAITRQTRHVADDETPYGYLRTGNSLIPKLASETWFTSQAARNSFLGQPTQTQEATDRLPDLFQIQAGTVSAKFIFDYNTPHEPILQQYEDLKVKDSIDGAGRIERFTVTDSQGFKFYFGVSKDGIRSAQNWDETLANYTFPSVGSYNFTTPGSFFKTYNSWYLMDIESPQGELVSFEYVEETSEYFRRSYDELLTGNGVACYAAKVQSHQYQLQKITHSGGEIVFDRVVANDRDDLKGSYALDKISIYDHDLNFVKAFKLTQSYQTATGTSNLNSELNGLEAEASKRLFLDAVVEQGKNGATKPPYTFTYTSTNIAKLPNRFSNSQDYWGYYNGAANGQFLTFSNYGSFNIDRKVNVAKSMAGMLVSMTYPTGGRTSFTYEHNKGMRGPEHQDLVLPEINPLNTENNFNAYLGHLMYNDGDSHNSTTNVYSKTFTIGPNQTGNLDYSVWFQNDTGCSETVITGDCRFNVTLKNNTTNTTYVLFKGEHNFFSISPGSYTLTVDPVPSTHDPINNTDDHFVVGVSWQEQVNETQLYAAGKRIKRISFYDNDGSLNPEFSKEYDYGLGIILGISSFHTLATNESGPFLILDMLGAVPGSPLSTYQGNSVGYPEVTEYHGNKDINTGKTVYDYLLQRDTGDYTTFPYHPPTDNEWLRGLPNTIKNYRKNTGNNYTLVSQTAYKYLYGNQFISGTNTPNGNPEIFTPKPKRWDVGSANMPFGTALNDEGLPYDKNNTMFRLPLIHLYYPDGQAAVNGDLDYKVFHFTGGTMHQFSTTETLYYGGQTVVNYTENGFNYPRHYQVASTFSEASDAQAIIKQFSYPQDNVGATGIMGDLVAAHRFVPIETKTYKDVDEDGTADSNELLSVEKVVYAQHNGIPQPQDMQYAKGDILALEDRVKYHSYNDLGKPLEVSQADGPITSYIWGHNQMYPIAKIENASYADIAAALSVPVSTLKNYDEGDLALFNGLRTNSSLPHVMVTTYTYAPLVGMTSMTDPRGNVTTYTYDDLNRLHEVKDRNNHLLSENQYQYKN
ncbi:RHS repeat domain-containing protein [uncultured Croceitalea sp.]|uniref:RHS repeat domain-containing protein n=1 Tax=uncultured Croceitalea sp. TaxID=1798908 RepID=UPI003306463F